MIFVRAGWPQLWGFQTPAKLNVSSEEINIDKTHLLLFFPQEYFVLPHGGEIEFTLCLAQEQLNI